MVASTTETSFNKITFNQENFHVLLFIYRLKLKQFEKLNGSKKSFKLMKFQGNIPKYPKDSSKRFCLGTEKQNLKEVPGSIDQIENSRFLKKFGYSPWVNNQIIKIHIPFRSTSPGAVPGDGIE